MNDAEDYRRWQLLWDQVKILIARLDLMEKHELNSAESLTQVRAIVLDIGAAQSFMRLTAEGEISSPRITELQEKISLSLANLEMTARKLKEKVGTPEPFNLDTLKGYRRELSSSTEELTSVVSAGYQRLKVK